MFQLGRLFYRAETSLYKSFLHMYDFSMFSLKRYLRFPSKAPYAWFVYSIMYLFLYIIIIFMQEQGFRDATTLQQTLEDQKILHIATTTWEILILIPIMQMVYSIVVLLIGSKNNLSVEKIKTVLLLVTILWIVAFVIFFILGPTTSVNIFSTPYAPHL